MTTGPEGYPGTNPETVRFGEPLAITAGPEVTPPTDAATPQSRIPGDVLGGLMSDGAEGASYLCNGETIVGADGSTAELRTDHDGRPFIHFTWEEGSGDTQHVRVEDVEVSPSGVDATLNGLFAPEPDSTSTTSHTEAAQAHPLAESIDDIRAQVGNLATSAQQTADTLGDVRASTTATAAGVGAINIVVGAASDRAARDAAETRAAVAEAADQAHTDTQATQAAVKEVGDSIGRAADQAHNDAMETQQAVTDASDRAHEDAEETRRQAARAAAAAEDAAQILRERLPERAAPPAAVTDTINPIDPASPEAPAQTQAASLLADAFNAIMQNGGIANAARLQQMLGGLDVIQPVLTHQRGRRQMDLPSLGEIDPVITEQHGLFSRALAIDMLVELATRYQNIHLVGERGRALQLELRALTGIPSPSADEAQRLEELRQQLGEHGYQIELNPPPGLAVQGVTSRNKYRETYTRIISLNTPSPTTTNTLQEWATTADSWFRAREIPDVQEVAEPAPQRTLVEDLQLFQQEADAMAARATEKRVGGFRMPSAGRSRREAMTEGSAGWQTPRGRAGAIKIPIRFALFGDKGGRQAVAGAISEHNKEGLRVMRDEAGGTLNLARNLAVSAQPGSITGNTQNWDSGRYDRTVSIMAEQLEQILGPDHPRGRGR